MLKTDELTAQSFLSEQESVIEEMEGVVKIKSNLSNVIQPSWDSGPDLQGQTRPNQEK